MSKNISNDYDLDRDFKNIWHPCTQMKEYESEPPLLIDSCILYTSDAADDTP